MAESSFRGRRVIGEGFPPPSKFLNLFAGSFLFSSLIMLAHGSPPNLNIVVRIVTEKKRGESSRKPDQSKSKPGAGGLCNEDNFEYPAGNTTCGTAH